MRVIIAGSRTVRAYATVQKAVQESGFLPLSHGSVILSGGQKAWDSLGRYWYGADYFGEQWAIVHNIPIERRPAHWNLYGKAAGPRRNAEMARVADGLVAVWDGKSRGTADMVQRARDAGLRVFVYTIAP